MANVEKKNGTTKIGAVSWIEELYDTNPYNSFDEQSITYDPQGWGSNEPVFEELISEISPEMIIEVGSWKGASANNMANITKEKGLKATVFCVDTWLGSEEHWLRHQDDLNLKDGYPHLFYQFLANVKHKNNDDVIVPLPQPSTVAADFFIEKNVMADLIYIDASHKLEHVFADIHAYWPLLEKGGILFGDDYNPARWPEVNRAVNVFAKHYDIAVEERYERFWIMRKDKDLDLKGFCDLLDQS